MDKIMITIGRQFGSGGREIGKKIARELEQHQVTLMKDIAMLDQRACAGLPPGHG